MNKRGWPEIGHPFFIHIPMNSLKQLRDIKIRALKMWGPVYKKLFDIG